MLRPRAVWITHRDPSLLAAQLAGAACAIIPWDLFHDQPGDWRAQIRAQVPLIYAYKRINHGPHLEDCTPEAADWLEAAMVQHFGAQTDQAAWQGPNRTLYWWDETRLDPFTVAVCYFAWMQGRVLPYIDGVMFDYLEQGRLEWQRRLIAEFVKLMPTLGIICNGRPSADSAGRFLESMGRHWWQTFPEVVEARAINAPLVLDLFRKPELRELAETVAAMHQDTAVYICEGRMRDTGLATT